MSKVTLADVGSLGRTTTAATTINSNSAAIVAALDNTLSRDGASPSQMLSALDMNSNRIVNLPSPISSLEPVRLTDLSTYSQTGTVVFNPLPVGGTTGQLLKKSSNTDYDIGWQSLSALSYTSFPPSKGHLIGLNTSPTTGSPTNNIDITAGECASDGSAPYLMVLPTALTKYINVAWAVGTNQGGLDSGSVINGSYHIYIIQRSDTGVVDVCFSVSATGPVTGVNIPTAYDRFRRVASVLRITGANYSWSQNGDFFKYTVPYTERDSTVAYASNPFNFHVPVGINVRPILNIVQAQGLLGDTTTTLGDGSGGGGYASVCRTQIAGELQSPVTDAFITNTSGQLVLSIAIVGGSLGVNRIFTMGYHDTRGRI